MRPRTDRRGDDVTVYRRFAIYYTPPPGALADFGAAWLGWDVAAGRPVASERRIAGVAEITSTPRRYGFHATLKPPFRLAEGSSPDALGAAAADVAARLSPIRAEGLKLSRLGRFLALVPEGDDGPISQLAAALVRGLDAFRAPHGEDELARRRANGLTPAQDALLLRWGYPFVMDEFRFHMTLSGRLEPAMADRVEAEVSDHLSDLPLRPFEIRDVTLVGEDADGYFHQVQRIALSG